jgi:hypothetical protein
LGKLRLIEIANLLDETNNGAEACQQLSVSIAGFELDRFQEYTTDACYEKRGFGSTRRQMNSNSPVLFRS